MFDRTLDFVADKCCTPFGVGVIAGAWIAASFVLIDKFTKYNGIVYDAAHNGAIIQSQHAIIQLDEDIDKWQESAEFDSIE